MDEASPPSNRSRRALPLIAAALSAIIVAGLLYLRSVAPAPTSPTLAFSPIPTMSGPFSATYDFISPTIGWAIVVDYTGLATNFWIFKTTDGAAHWRQQYQAQAEGGYTFIHFFDAVHGLAYAGRLFRTSDGGNSWEFVFTPAGERYAGPLVTFASPTLGWSLDFEDGAGRMYKTTDGGTTWRRLPADFPPAAVLEPLSATVPSAFRVSGEGWLGAGYLESPIVYRTTDGAATWATVAISSPQSGARYLTTVRLIPDGTVLVLVSDEGRLLRAFSSADQGGSWKEVSLPPSLTTSDDLSIADARHWWASHGGAIFKTADAGQTWQQISAAGLPTDWNYQVAHLIDADHAWWPMISSAHSTDSALAMTSDGGAHWKLVNLPSPE